MCDAAFYLTKPSRKESRTICCCDVRDGELHCFLHNAARCKIHGGMAHTAAYLIALYQLLTVKEKMLQEYGRTVKWITNPKNYKILRVFFLASNEV